MLEAESSPMDVGPGPLEAEAIAAAAYIFGFPLVLSDTVHTAVASREQVAFCEDGGADPAFCLDLRAGALVLQMSPGVLLFRDGWTNLFASLPPEGATAGQARAFALVGPGWRGETPAGCASVRAPTDLVWVVASGPGSARWVLPPSLRAGEGGAIAVVSGRLLSAAVERVSRLGAGTYLSRLARLMRRNPPSAADEPLLARLRRIGIAPGEPTRLACLPGALKPALVSGIAAARAAMAARGRAVTAARAGLDYWDRALWSSTGLLSAPAQESADS